MSFALLAVDPTSDPEFRRFYRPPATQWTPRPEGSTVRKCEPCAVTWYSPERECWSCGEVPATA